MLAIVIPYYKRSFFKETLQSLANQTDKRFKVYIGDDASFENPLDLLEHYKGTFDFKYKRFETNVGATSLVKQWERCIAMTEDEAWLMILGDDDYLGINVVEAFYKHYDTFCKKSNLVRFSQHIFYENNTQEDIIVENVLWEKANESYYNKFIGKSSSSLSEYIFSKESYLKYKFVDYPLAWNSDDNAWLDFSDKLPIYGINNAQVYVRISDINISGKDDNLKLKNKSKITFYKHLIKNNKYLFKKEQVLALAIGYESELKKFNKISLQEWIFLFKIHSKYFNLFQFLKLIRRGIINLFK